jgi:glycosyltransferase involved in cell wall biosynthesis
MMRVLQISTFDVLGRRFNGYDINISLRQDSIHASQMVLIKESRDEHVIDLSKTVEDCNNLRHFINKQEFELSVRGMLFPFGRAIAEHDEFLSADIVHYHQIYNEILSLAHFAELTYKKPSLLSLHECTLLTGHCIHPMKCNRFETGCSECPEIGKQFAMKNDNAALMWAVKNKVFTDAAIELVVGSQWMLEMVKRSPYMSKLKTHLIPFGIDVEFYAKPRPDARYKLSIPEDAFVLFFRSQYVNKGLEQIINALALMDEKPFLVNCLEIGYFDNYSGDLLEMGVVTDDEVMAELYIECMASGKPIIVADGTALPDVTFSPEVGISVPQGDAEALKNAIELLRDNPEERHRRGMLAQEIARKHYSYDEYYRKQKELYIEIASRRIND